MLLVDAGGTKDGDRGPNILELFKSVDKFRHDAENAPWIFQHFQVRGFRDVFLFYHMPYLF